MLKQIKNFWILLRTVFSTISTTLQVIISSQLNRPRPTIDKILQNWAKNLLKITQAKITINPSKLTSYPTNRACIIMSNHASLYDIPTVLASFPPGLRMISKVELKKVPLFGHSMVKSGFVFIDRQNRRQAIKDLAVAKQQLESGTVLWMAPEGTRSKTGKLLTFKQGVFKLAMQTNAIIIPVGLIGTNKILPAKKLTINTKQSITVNIGQPIDTTNYSPQQIEQLIHRVRNQISELLTKQIS